MIWLLRALQLVWAPLCLASFTSATLITFLRQFPRTAFWILLLLPGASFTAFFSWLLHQVSNFFREDFTDRSTKAKGGPFCSYLVSWKAKARGQPTRMMLEHWSIKIPTMTLEVSATQWRQCDVSKSFSREELSDFPCTTCSRPYMNHSSNICWINLTVESSKRIQS